MQVMKSMHMMQNAQQVALRDGCSFVNLQCQSWSCCPLPFAFAIVQGLLICMQSIDDGQVNLLLLCICVRRTQTALTYIRSAATGQTLSSAPELRS